MYTALRPSAVHDTSSLWIYFQYSNEYTFIIVLSPVIYIYLLVGAACFFFTGIFLSHAFLYAFFAPLYPFLIPSTLLHISHIHSKFI